MIETVGITSIAVLISLIAAAAIAAHADAHNYQADTPPPPPGNQPTTTPWPARQSPHLHTAVPLDLPMRLTAPPPHPNAIPCDTNGIPLWYLQHLGRIAALPAVPAPPAPEPRHDIGRAPGTRTQQARWNATTATFDVAQLRGLVAAEAST